MIDPAGKTYLVTGGGSGIGRSIVEHLAASGSRVVTCGRRAAALEETAARCQSLPGTVEPVVADLTQRDQLDHVVAVTGGASGRIDGIVNNAGMVLPVMFPHWREEDLDALLELNLRVPIRLVQRAWTSLEAAAGRIVNLSSLAVLMPFPSNGAYGVSKSALDGLTRAIHVEARDSGVQAFSLALGAVETAMLRELVDETLLPPEKAMDPREIADLVRACLDGERDDQAGRVLYAAIPGLVTVDPGEADAALAAFHAPEGVG